MTLPNDRRDLSTYSNPHEVRITHSDFAIDLDFDSRRMHWWAKHQVLVEMDGASELLLDSRDLTIHSESVFVNGQKSIYTTKQSSKALGTAISIPMPSALKKGDIVTVELSWKTSPTAIAAQWLEGTQTCSGKPFLFTQCQAIHARSICPCQDTPGAKFTYTAAVRAPEDLTPLMSALIVGKDIDTDTTSTGLEHMEHLCSSDDIGKTRISQFRQPVPISSYLLSLGCGELNSQDLSPSIRVWAEPSIVSAAAYEFADTPTFLEAAERLTGRKIQWTRYDMLVLPGGFPYGGMELPNLVLVTPTLLAGDRSLANVVAHELAHMWTGNLVTNRSWKDFWLNEGWTVWLERRILAELAGEEDGDKTFDFHASMGWGSMVETVRHWGESNPFTALVPPLKEEDPDDAFSEIPYEKGFAFITYLERLCGGKRVFIPFFQAYLKRFEDQPLTAEDFKAFFIDYFTNQAPTDDDTRKTIESIDWDTWLYKPGMPPVANKYDETMVRQAFSLAEKWATHDVMGIGSDSTPECSETDMDGWSSSQIVAFLDKLNELRSMTPLHSSTTRAMAHCYPLLESTKNAEIRNGWYLLCIKAGDKSVLGKLDEFLGSQGRMKFLRPLFRALKTSKRWTQGEEKALEMFEKHKDKYHPIASKMVMVDLKLIREEEA